MASVIADCQEGTLISAILQIIDRKTIFASISIADDDYAPGMNVHERIKRGRERLGLTEEEFGAKVGVTRGAVQHWERGKTAPNRARQSGVAALLGLTVAELMSEFEAERPKKYWPFSAELLDRFTVLGDKQKGIVEGKLEAAIEKCEMEALQLSSEEQKIVDSSVDQAGTPHKVIKKSA